MADAQTAPTRLAGRRPRSACARIKLSRELVLRLSSALTERREWARPSPRTAHQDIDGAAGSNHSSNHNYKQLANCSMKTTTTTTATTTPPARQRHENCAARADNGPAAGCRHAWPATRRHLQARDGHQIESMAENGNNNENNNNGTDTRTPAGAVTIVPDAHDAQHASQRRLGSGAVGRPRLGPEPATNSISGARYQLANATSCSKLTSNSQRRANDTLEASRRPSQPPEELAGAASHLEAAARRPPSPNLGPAQFHHHQQPQPPRASGGTSGGPGRRRPSRRPAHARASDAPASKSTVILISSSSKSKENQLEAEWADAPSCCGPGERPSWLAAGERWRRRASRKRQKLINSGLPVAGRLGDCDDDDQGNGCCCRRQRARKQLQLQVQVNVQVQQKQAQGCRQEPPPSATRRLGPSWRNKKQADENNSPRLRKPAANRNKTTTSESNNNNNNNSDADNYSRNRYKRPSRPAASPVAGARAPVPELAAGSCKVTGHRHLNRLLALGGLLLLAGSLALGPQLAAGSTGPPTASLGGRYSGAGPGYSSLALHNENENNNNNDKQTTSDESDELSRAILATMSTQSSVASNTRLASSGAASQLDDHERQWLSSPNSSQANELLGATSAAGAGPWPGEPPTPFPAGSRPQSRFERFLEEALNFARIFIMGAIIVGDICGNSLVILSVCRHSKLRVTTNWFVVSLACADILVALFAMTFNASVIISGRWLFKRWVCDFWNSCDVLASTASILHLCCISIDRYIAIMRPLDYPMKITTRRVMWALCAVWVSSALLSYIPIFTGIYTTSEHIEWLRENPDQCEFVVNRVYAIVSSSISFWIPCCIMVFTYYRIYREATRQEKFIYKTQSLAPAANHHHQQNHAHQQPKRPKQARSKSVAAPAAPRLQHHQQLAQQTRQKLRALPANRDLLPSSVANSSGSSGLVVTTNLSGQLQQRQPESEPLTGSAVDLNNNSSNSNSNNGKSTAAPQQLQLQQQQQQQPPPTLDDPDERDSNSGQSTPTKRSISKMKREHKAAKTLGIIMGVFILCWLPFFSWYTPQHICGHACEGMVPRQVVTLLFWIGYFNSTLNPIIYAYFNHEFRDAFKKTLQWIFCCCQDLKCLRVSRPNEGQHYNCTYRSTQEIGLVSS